MSYEVLTETVEIDGEKYEIRLLDAIHGYRVYVKLLNAVGGALEGAGSLKGSSKGELALKTIGAALKNLSPELAEELRSTFAKTTCIVKPDGKKPELKDVFLTHFRGRYAHMSKWLFACIKANFADFLAEGSSEGGPSPLEALKAMFQEKPPTASTGSSSES